ncbi:MAG TPA: hypothetical protein VKU19_34590 [Bryobacteraceae bacterium]|nr:hypothetical protein [Bryobacteraceae bacterium]
MLTPLDSKEWTPPTPEEIDEHRENAGPEDSDACMEMTEALLDTREFSMRREAMLWAAQAALLEEPDACYYLGLDCHILKINELGRVHLNTCKQGTMGDDAERELRRWHLGDLDRDAGVFDENEHPDDSPEVAGLRESVDLTEGDSCLALGEALLRIDAPWAKSEALQWFIQAALLGETAGNYHLGLYWKELGNTRMAEHHLRLAARRGHEEAATELCGGESEEIYALREAAKDGDSDACYQLAEALRALDAQKYDEEVQRLWTEAARQDHPEAHYQLALRSRQEGQRPEAGYHLRAAAEQRYKPAEKLLDEWKIEGFHPFDDDDEAAELLTEAAARGVNSARYQLAGRIREGRGVACVPDRAAGLYRLAAEDGHAPSMCQLAHCYQKGYGVPCDAKRAREWMEKAAAQNDPAALYELGTYYREAGDMPAATGCFERAAALGNADALFALAGSQDDSNKPSMVAEAAEKGNAEAQFELGTYFENGAPGYPKDEARAAEWYERAADQDNAKALAALANLTLRSGETNERQTSRAWSQITRAANLGDVNSMMKLAAHIDSGEEEGMEPESAAYVALYWYQRAAEAGNADAQYTAALRMLNNRHERERARGFLEGAAKQGHTEAQALLDNLGPEPEPDVPTASSLVAAAVAGDAASQYSLAVWHFNGYEVKQSFPLCYFWSKVLHRTSPDEAQGLIDMVVSEITTHVRKKLDKQAAAWTPGTVPPAA